MKPREEYDKEALVVFADLDEQKIGPWRNLLFARRNIFLILLYILCCVEFTLKRFRGEKKKKKKKIQKSAAQLTARRDDDGDDDDDDYQRK